MTGGRLPGLPRSGFTIVELLIVIVVIGVLAAITVVSYTGINSQAKLSAIKTTAEQIGKKLETWKLQNAELYPVDLSAARTASGVASLTTYIVSPDRKNYCASVTDDALPAATRSYAYTSKSGGAVVGECVTNLIPNPSFESNTTGWAASWGTGGAGSLSRLTNGGVSGSSYARVTWTATPSVAWGGINGPQSFPVADGQSYYFSVWVRPSANHPLQPFLRFNGYPTIHDISSGVVAVGANAWTRMQVSASLSAGATTMQTNVSRNGSGSWQAGDYLDVDAGMLTSGSSRYDYRDGDSPGWFWNGDPNNSSSTGPAVAL